MEVTTDNEFAVLHTQSKGDLLEPIEINKLKNDKNLVSLELDINNSPL